MEQSGIILQGATDIEKGDYLGAIASLATADRSATEEELSYLNQLADAASLDYEQKAAVIKAASEITEDDTMRCLDILKTSDLKFSLVTDLIAFAKSDNDYSPDEQQTIRTMADYLGVNKEQFSALDQFTDSAVTSQSPGVSNNATQPNQVPGTIQKVEESDFLSSLGLKEKLQSVGINGGGLLRGLLGIAAPMILAKMVGGGRNRNRGGIFGGGGMNEGGGMLGSGGLGSIFSMLNGGGGGYRRTGGLLSRIFGGIF